MGTTQEVTTGIVVSVGGEAKDLTAKRLLAGSIGTTDETAALARLTKECQVGLTSGRPRLACAPGKLVRLSSEELLDAVVNGLFDVPKRSP